MKSRNKKQGTAYRHYKQRSSLHGKQGKNRKRANSQQRATTVKTFAYEGWTAVQDVRNKLLTVSRPDGIPFTEFMVEHKLKDFELRGYIDYCIKVSSMREGDSLCD